MVYYISKEYCMNIKFPKEETRVLEIVRNALLKKDYKVLLEQYDNVFNYSMFINQYNEFIINSYVEALFKIKEYDKLLNLVEHLRSKDMESCNWYFYCLMYLLSNKDLLLNSSCKSNICFFLIIVPSGSITFKST